MTDRCAICESELSKDASACGTCGAPTDVAERRERGERSECPECGGALWSQAERCPSCGARGYPALRPRFGDKSVAGPDEPANGE